MTRTDLAVFFRAARDLLLPRVCAVCREAIPADVPGRLCAGCLVALEDLGGDGRDACARCAAPREGKRCRRCPNAKGKSPVEAAVAFGPFEGVLRQAVHALKFGGDPGLGKALGRLVARAVGRRSEPRSADLVIPVPLHFSRLFERGYNQSAVLARQVAQALGKPLVLDALVRTRGAAEQSGSTRTQRQENVRDAFLVRGERVDGRTVLLVDDVLTTGATARECAVALQRAGAKKVYVAALARAREGGGA